jgi:starch synthase
VRGMGFTGKLVTVCNGVPLPASASADADRKTLEKLGIPAERGPGQITCLFLANHTPNKGLPVLLEAFSRLDIPYLLVVGGETRPSINYSRFMAMGRPDQRIIITGRVGDAEVGALFRRSDLFVFPTLADTFPLVVLEAMSHGVPVLASNVGGIPHQIDEGCGVLVRPGCADSLSKAVSALAAEPGRLAAMGRSAHARVATEFTWERAAAEALAGYRQVITQGSVGA